MLKKLSLLLIFSVGLNGCIYKMDIHQGNVLDQEQIDKLETGMSKNAVIALLGSPQLTDPFHSQRWDYYSMSNLKNQRRKTENVLTLTFEGDLLTAISKPDLPPPAKEEDKKLLW